MEAEPGEWGFKALKQSIKLHCSLHEYPQMLEKYKKLLTYISSAVTKNVTEKGINSMLEIASSTNAHSLLQEFYCVTLDVLQSNSNERLWFNTTLKLCKLYFEQDRLKELDALLTKLHRSCENERGDDDPKKGTQLLEIYALRIQVYTKLKLGKKLRELYMKALLIKSAIPHPRILGVIRECAGKMKLSERDYEGAYTDFFEAFKAYDEAGSHRRIQCLKYVVLSNMLTVSSINAFDSQEAKAYKNDPAIVNMTDLLSAYQRNDIKTFESILAKNSDILLDDEFIRENIVQLFKNIRTHVLLEMLKPYTRIRLQFLAKELNIEVGEVETLLASLILDGRIVGKMDQLEGVLLLDIEGERRKGAATAVHKSPVDEWTTQLEGLIASYERKLA